MDNNLKFYSPIELGSTIINKDNINTKSATIGDITINNNGNGNIENVGTISATTGSFESIEVSSNTISVGSNTLNNNGIQTTQIIVKDANTNANVSIKSSGITGTGDLSFGNITATQQINANKIIINDTITIGNKSDTITISNKGIEGLTDLSFDQLNTNPTLTIIKRRKTETILDNEDESHTLASLTNDKVEKEIVWLRFKSGNTHAEGVDFYMDQLYPLYLYKHNNFVTLYFSEIIHESLLYASSDTQLGTISEHFRPKRTIYFNSLGTWTKETDPQTEFSNLNLKIGPDGHITCINTSQSTTGNDYATVGFTVTYYLDTDLPKPGSKPEQDQAGSAILAYLTENKEKDFSKITQCEQTVDLKSDYFWYPNDNYSDDIDNFIVYTDKVPDNFFKDFHNHAGLIIRIDADKWKPKDSYKFNNSSSRSLETIKKYYKTSSPDHNKIDDIKINSETYTFTVPGELVKNDLIYKFQHLQYYTQGTNSITYKFSQNIVIPKNDEIPIKLTYYIPKTTNSTEYIQHFTESK